MGDRKAMALVTVAGKLFSCGLVPTVDNHLSYVKKNDGITCSCHEIFCQGESEGCCHVDSLLDMVKQVTLLHDYL